MIRSFTTATLSALAAAALLAGTAQAQETRPLRIGVITFLSGPAAGPFGVPAKNAADLLVEAFNKGGVVPGYEQKGFGGRPVELAYVDEAGGPTKVVTEYRNLVSRQNVDMVIGVISSGDCLAVAPVAEEMKKLTVLFDCSTNRVFEEASYKYVFRTTTMATQENVAAARYVAEMYPNLKTFSGVNPNYAWGQDAWSDFTESLKQLKPQAQIATNSLWGGDIEAFVLQSSPRGLLQKSPNIIICGDTILERLGNQLVDGTMIGARGPNGPFAPATKLNKWFSKAFHDQYKSTPVYSSYHMATAFFGAKAAYERALKTKKAAPTDDDIIASFERLKFESVSGIVDMSLGKGHQAVQHVPYGTVKFVDGKLTLTNVKYYTPEQISPPDGVKSIDWIRSGFKR